MRFVPILNAIGCLLLTVVIVVQWKQGHAVSNALTEAQKREILALNEKVELEKRASLLQADVEGLKASIASIEEAARLAESSLEERTAQANALNEGLGQAQEKFQEWELAISQRDEKIKELNEALVATRARLDKAVAELKKAGAR